MQILRENKKTVATWFAYKIASYLIMNKCFQGKPIGRFRLSSIGGFGQTHMDDGPANVFMTGAVGCLTTRINYRVISIHDSHEEKEGLPRTWTKLHLQNARRFIIYLVQKRAEEQSSLL